MQVTAGRTRIDLHPDTGAIAGIEDTLAGRVLLDAFEGGRTDGRLLRIITPRPMWWSRYADSHEQTVEIAPDGEGIALRVNDLVTPDGPSGLRASVQVRPSGREDEIGFSMQLENHGQSTVTEVLFPWLGGWTGYGGPGEDTMALGGSAWQNPHGFPTGAGTPYARAPQRAGFYYPVNLYAPWVDLSGPGGGLSYINYMPEPENGYVSLENLAGYERGLRLAFGWAHTIALQPGDTWTSPEIGIAAHGGDWHETADRYTAWSDEKLQPADTPMSVRTGIGFQNVFFRGFDGTPIRDLTEIPQVATIGKKYGVDHLCVWDYLTLGNYAKHDPVDLMDYAGADREHLETGLAVCKELGIMTSALTNFRHPNASAGDAAMQTQIKRRYDGTALTENWSGSHNHGQLWMKHMGPESYVYSPFSPEHRERVLRQTGEYLNLGYTSIFYDQPFETHGDYGFIPAGHRPEHTHREALRMVADVRRAMREQSPEAIVIGEECDPFASQWIDLWMSWRFSAIAAADGTAAIRYSIPRTILSWVVDTQPDRASLAFALGMQLCLMVRGGEGTLDDEPALASHVAALQRLRKATAERTVLARFRHHKGLTIDATDGLYAYSFESAQGPAVALAAVGREASGTVIVDRDSFADPGDPQAGELVRLDGTREATTGDTHDFELAADEVAVWTL